MLGSTAQLPLVPVAAEVVTLTELATDNFLRVIPGQTLALAADTVTAVVAQSLTNQKLFIITNVWPLRSYYYYLSGVV